MSESKNYFTLIQSRRFWSPIEAISLCPSMDLIVFGLPQTLWLHRTVNWQKLANLPQSISCSVWRPDGRVIAVANDKDIQIYDIEALLASTETPLAKLPQRADRLCWAHIGNVHPDWERTSDETEQEVYWKFRKRYLSQDLLPPSRYHQGVQALSHSAPLNVLYALNDKNLNIYLYGRYPVLSDYFIDLEETPEMMVSHDLTHILLQNSRKLAILSIPSLASKRYYWQTISAMYASINSHLENLQRSIYEVGASYKSSLKPLDLKIQALTRLLQNYNLKEANLKHYLTQYILSGHTSQTPTLTNAIDQFFTSVQMNDQLITRMERSLTVAVANVESQVRESLLAPAQALVYEINQLIGVETPPIALIDCAKLVLVMVEQSLTELVDARFRLADLVAWLRSTGAEIKARGTAPDSVQRENAKLRRCDDATTRRMLQYLQLPDGDNCGLTERILGLQFHALLQDSPKPISIRTLLPKNVNSVDNAGHTLPATGYVAGKLAEQIETFFLRPCNELKVFETFVELPARGRAISTSRIGFGGGATEGFFIASQELDADTRQWVVTAQAAKNQVDLYAIPLTWIEPAFDGKERNEGDVGIANTSCGCLRLALPSNCTIRDIGFYGDDGKSTLRAGVDKAIGKEGRQGLGLLIESSGSLELWLLSYDALPFHLNTLEKTGLRSFAIQPNPLQESIRVEVLRNGQVMDEGISEDGVVYARTRCVGTFDGSAQLLLNGSRGVGAIITDKGNALELLDLVEDEEDDNESMSVKED